MAGPLRVFVVDGDLARRAGRVVALRARGLQVDEAVDAVAALAELPRLDPDVLVLSLDSAAMDLETVARGIVSMRALGHLQLLAIGDSRPLSEATHAIVTVLAADATDAAIAKEADKLGQRARRRRHKAPK